MTAPTAPPPTAAEAAAGWRHNLSFTEKMLQEAMYEYTSKERLRRLAVIGLATLQAMYANAAEQADALDAQNNIIVPATEMP